MTGSGWVTLFFCSFVGLCVCGFVDFVLPQCFLCVIIKKTRLRTLLLRVLSHDLKVVQVIHLTHSVPPTTTTFTTTTTTRSLPIVFLLLSSMSVFGGGALWVSYYPCIRFVTEHPHHNLLRGDVHFNSTDESCLIPSFFKFW